MALYTIYIPTLLLLLNFSSAWSACIFLQDCTVALKYIEKRRNDPETMRILKTAHCGYGIRGGSRQAKLFCERIPDFEPLPPSCIYLNDCPEALQLINTRKYEPEVIQLLRSSTCGYSDRKDKIICNNFSTKSTGKNKSNLLPKLNECGLQMPDSKITGGQVADLEDFPWIALFKYKNETGHVEHRCHGTLISNRYVVTAAHCLSLTSEQLRKLGNLNTIVLGEYNIKTSNDCMSTFNEESYCTDPVQEFSPEEIHIHPTFGANGLGYDIALVRLDRNATFTEFVKPICLPLNPLDLVLNEPLLIAGWGKTETNNMSNVKLKARIYYLRSEACSGFTLDETQICAGSGSGSDTCKGDSGGPLMVLRKNKDNDINNILAGIVSFGARCGSGYAVYTNVATFRNWILETIHE